MLRLLHKWRNSDKYRLTANHKWACLYKALHTALSYRVTRGYKREQERTKKEQINLFLLVPSCTLLFLCNSELCEGPKTYLCLTARRYFSLFLHSWIFVPCSSVSLLSLTFTNSVTQSCMKLYRTLQLTVGKLTVTNSNKK